MANPAVKPVDLDEVKTSLASQGNPWVSATTSMTGTSPYVPRR